MTFQWSLRASAVNAYQRFNYVMGRLTVRMGVTKSNNCVVSVLVLQSVSKRCNACEHPSHELFDLVYELEEHSSIFVYHDGLTSAKTVRCIKTATRSFPSKYYVIVKSHAGNPY